MIQSRPQVCRYGRSPVRKEGDYKQMAKRIQYLCDRCGEPIKYVGWTAIFLNVFKRGKKIEIRELYNGNPDGYSYLERRYELCSDCTKQLEKFLNNNQKS